METKMKTKLKPCPFCGEQAQVEARGKIAMVRCETCLASIAAYGRNSADAAELAAKAWNQRVERMCRIEFKQTDHEYRDPKENWRGVCSSCGRTIPIDEWDTGFQPPKVVSCPSYCPSCGARIVNGTGPGEWATDKWGAKYERNRLIWEERKKGRTYADIGREFGITRGRVNDICKRERFREEWRESHPRGGGDAS